MSTYTRPSADAVNFAFTGTAYTRTSDFAFGVDAVTGDAAATLSITADAAGTFASSIHFDGDGAVTINPTASASGGHGVAGAGAATISISEAAAGAHGVAGSEASTISVTAAAVGVHERYEVRGEVRDGGILVNRRVRIYRRDSGALVGESDTIIGRFQVNTGFAPREHYVIPVDLSDAATDWTPPVANRVLSVLAQDA